MPEQAFLGFNDFDGTVQPPLLDMVHNEQMYRTVLRQGVPQDFGRCARHRLAEEPAHLPINASHTALVPLCFTCFEVEKPLAPKDPDLQDLCQCATDLTKAPCFMCRVEWLEEQREKVMSERTHFSLLMNKWIMKCQCPDTMEMQLAAEGALEYVRKCACCNGLVIAPFKNWFGQPLFFETLSDKLVVDTPDMVQPPQQSQTMGHPGGDLASINDGQLPIDPDFATNFQDVDPAMQPTQEQFGHQQPVSPQPNGQHVDNPPLSNQQFGNGQVDGWPFNFDSGPFDFGGGQVDGGQLGDGQFHNGNSSNGQFFNGQGDDQLSTQPWTEHPHGLHLEVIQSPATHSQQTDPQPSYFDPRFHDQYNHPPRPLYRPHNTEQNDPPPSDSQSPSPPDSSTPDPTSSSPMLQNQAPGNRQVKRYRSPLTEDNSFSGTDEQPSEFAANKHKKQKKSAGLARETLEGNHQKTKDDATPASIPLARQNAAPYSFYAPPTPQMPLDAGQMPGAAFPAPQAPTTAQTSGGLDPNTIHDFAKQATNAQPSIAVATTEYTDGSSNSAANNASHLSHPAGNLPISRRKTELRRRFEQSAAAGEQLGRRSALYKLRGKQDGYNTEDASQVLSKQTYEAMLVECAMGEQMKKVILEFVEKVWGGTVGTKEIWTVAKIALSYRPCV